MQKLIVIILVTMGLGAQASLESFQGNYIATDLGCATPQSNRYSLSVSQSMTEYDKSLETIQRSVTVNASGSAGEAVFNCEVNYEGPLSLVDGEYYGTMIRGEFNCGPLNPRDTEGIIRAFIDPYFLESDVLTDHEVSFDGATLTIQQLTTPSQPLRGCGQAYPIFTYTKQ